MPRTHVHHFATIKNGMRLDDQINMYAKENHLEIKQVSFTNVDMSLVVEALVLFEYEAEF